MKTITEILGLPLWQLTGEEYVRLHAYACSKNNNIVAAPVTKVTGVQALAKYLSCCESTVYMLRRERVLDEAVISRVGKSIVFDAEKAQRLADDYMTMNRNINKKEI